MDCLIIQVVRSIFEFIFKFPLLPGKSGHHIGRPHYLTGKPYVVYRIESTIINLIAIVLEIIFMGNRNIQINLIWISLLLNYIIFLTTCVFGKKNYIKKLALRLKAIDNYVYKENHELRRILLEKYSDCSYDVYEIEKGLKEIGRRQSKKQLPD